MSILKVDKLGAVFFQNSWRFPTRWYLKIEIFLKYFFGQKITKAVLVFIRSLLNNSEFCLYKQLRNFRDWEEMNL